VSTRVLAAAAGWLEPAKYFNEPWGINTAYLTVGYKYRLLFGTGRSSLFALWEVPTKVIFMHQYKIIYLSVYICILIYYHSFDHGNVGHQESHNKMETLYD
jgi:hypothetical protein